jgi:hypothetical protein
MVDVRLMSSAWLRGVVVIGLAVAAFAGCGGSAARVRGYTYPPDFRYISPSELSSAMGQLAVGVKRLDELLRGGGAEGEPLQAEVVQQLGDLAGIAGGLSAGRMGTNHPWLNNNLGTFRRDVELARRAATHDPPNYYLAGTIVGACGYCHQRWE